MKAFWKGSHYNLFPAAQDEREATKAEECGAGWLGDGGDRSHREVGGVEACVGITVSVVKGYTEGLSSGTSGEGEGVVSCSSETCCTDMRSRGTSHGDGHVVRRIASVAPIVGKDVFLAYSKATDLLRKGDGFRFFFNINESRGKVRCIASIIRGKNLYYSSIRSPAIGNSFVVVLPVPS